MTTDLPAFGGPRDGASFPPDATPPPGYQLHGYQVVSNSSGRVTGCFVFVHRDADAPKTHTAILRERCENT